MTAMPDVATHSEVLPSELCRALVNIDSFLAAQIEARNNGDEDSLASLRGLYLSSSEASQLFRTRIVKAKADAAADLVRDLPRLQALAGREGFDDIETAVLLLAIAPEFDACYERVFAWLNDDVTRRWPTVDLVMKLFCSSLDERVACRARFTSEGRLIRSGLIRVIPDPNHLEPALPAHYLKPDEQAIRWFVDSREIDERLVGFCHLTTPAGPFPEEISACLAPICSSVPLRISLGGSASIVRAAADFIAFQVSQPLLTANLAEAGPNIWRNTLFRQAALADATLLIDDLNCLKTTRDRELFLDALTRHTGSVLVAGSVPWLQPPFTDVDLKTAQTEVGERWRRPEILSAAVRKLTPAYHWSEIVLPEDVAEQLRELCDRGKHQKTVLTQWGFEKKNTRGANLTALFFGPSGTGKTMAAEIIAHEFGQELLKIDLSQVISKFIGETEKNLGNVFDIAERSGAVLFFDEADALFGKRSTVKDAHDRYANIEVSYLLQRMEEYAGIAILATNLSHNMDPAFIRRLKFSIEFPFPDAPIRRRIWEIQFPAAAPVSGDIDWDFLAERFPIAGGGIRNVALNAAYFAAASGEAIHMRHIIRAVRREYQKMGRQCAEADFGSYYRIIDTRNKA